MGVPDAERFDLVDEIKAGLIKKFPEAERTEIDGIRLDFNDAMFVVRASQNGGYITIKFEAKTSERYDQLRHILREELLKYRKINWEEGVNTEAMEKKPSA